VRRHRSRSSESSSESSTSGQRSFPDQSRAWAPAVSPIAQRSSPAGHGPQRSPADFTIFPAGNAPPQPAGHLAGTVQRKRTYLNYKGNHVDFIRSKLDQLVLQEKLEPFTDTEFIYGLSGLTVSPLDYGVIDLSDEQHLLLLYHQIKKQAMPLEAEENRLVKNKPEKEKIEDQEKEASTQANKWTETKKRNKGKPTYKVALVGAGASIAYYIATMGRNLDTEDVVIIGPEQPWGGKRGPGVVAHPENMITPMLEFLGKTAIDDRWLERKEFSRLINEVLINSGFERIFHEVTDLDKEDGFYTIKIKDQVEPIYAQNVVAGAGVGGHSVPKGLDVGDTAQSSKEVSSAKRIMDMDVFTQVAPYLAKTEKGLEVAEDEEGDKSKITVVLSGGNGGIDVAFDALSKGYKVHWIVGSGSPKFLPGFFNYAAYLPYLRTLKKTDQLKRAGIEDADQQMENTENILPNLYKDQEDMFDGLLETFLDKKTEFAGVHFGYLTSAKQTVDGVEAETEKGKIQGDVLVYAQGQDNKTFELFDKFIEDLTPDMDVSGRFSDKQDATLGLKSKDDTLKIIGATAFRLAPQVVPAREQFEEYDGNLTKARQAIGRVYDSDKLKYSPFSTVWRAYRNLKEASHPHGGESSNPQGPLKDFATACAEYDKYRKTLKDLSLQQDDAVKLFDTALRQCRNQSQGLMQPVVATLPDNVLINDQLTPTRSQIVASNEFLPYDIGQKVSFLTADRTEIATHISAHYPKLADKLATTGDGKQEALELALKTIGKNPLGKSIEKACANKKTSVLEALIQGIIQQRRLGPKESPFAARAVPPHGKQFQAACGQILQGIEDSI
jgi:hypothetical protein